MISRGWNVTPFSRSIFSLSSSRFASLCSLCDSSDSEVIRGARLGERNSPKGSCLLDSIRVTDVGALAARGDRAAPPPPPRTETNGSRGESRFAAAESETSCSLEPSSAPCGPSLGAAGSAIDAEEEKGACRGEFLEGEPFFDGIGDKLIRGRKVSSASTFL